MLGGALLVPLATIAIAWAVSWLAPPRGPAFLDVLFTRALTPSGWIGLPLLGAGLGALLALGWVTPGRPALRLLLVALPLLVGGALLVARPPSATPAASAARPGSPRAKARAILKASFRSPATVATILPYAGDRDPVVRQQAVLALGVNLVVAGIEHETSEHPSPFARLPLRDSLRVRLLAALGDPVEDVRAEAARALWKAPRTFGAQPAAAETLAAVLDRALLPGSVERLTWLALDAAAGRPDPGLRAAAARFAAATPDPELARVARLAMAKTMAPEDGSR
jgi:hypothetical protein